MNAYLLAFTGCVALGGRLGDMLGLGRLFLTGLFLFGLGSLGAGLSDSGAELIGARAVQGIGAAFVFPATFAIMTRACSGTPTRNRPCQFAEKRRSA